MRHALCHCLSLIASPAPDSGRRNVESCGILAGTLAADDSVFTITTLIVPKQEGTSDTVQVRCLGGAVLLPGAGGGGG